MTDNARTGGAIYALYARSPTAFTELLPV
jgi:hypothetical protein